jgi:BON domain
VELQLDVAAELFWDPKVDAEQIAVSADNGTVTLRGTVGSFRRTWEAPKAARHVHGVTGVKDELQVQILNSDRREDAELRGDVLQALMLDSLVPTSVDAQVRDGFVTLRDPSAGSTSVTRPNSSPRTCPACPASRTASRWP